MFLKVIIWQHNTPLCCLGRRHSRQQRHNWPLCYFLEISVEMFFGEKQTQTINKRLYGTKMMTVVSANFCNVYIVYLKLSFIPTIFFVYNAPLYMKVF